jgi:L-alanine-DL-glutamate epimerase-like enolase superfamily enzyme
MIRRARELNLQVMIGCMNESTVGSAAIAHLLPFIDYVDMDGPMLLEEDVASGIEYDYGKIIYSDGPGLGINYMGLFKK